MVYQRTISVVLFSPLFLTVFSDYRPPWIQGVAVGTYLLRFFRPGDRPRGTQWSPHNIWISVRE